MIDVTAQIGAVLYFRMKSKRETHDVTVTTKVRRHFPLPFMSVLTPRSSFLIVHLLGGERQHYLTDSLF